MLISLSTTVGYRIHDICNTYNSIMIKILKHMLQPRDITIDVLPTKKINLNGAQQVENHLPGQ
jgi:hypothetical protein